VECSSWRLRNFYGRNCTSSLYLADVGALESEPPLALPADIARRPQRAWKHHVEKCGVASSDCLPQDARKEVAMHPCATLNSVANSHVHFDTR
jgi:hypothetical protein